MSILTKLIIAWSILLVFMSGCTDKKSDEPGVVDYMTGSESMKAYKDTKSKIENINTTLKKRYQEIE